MTRALFCALGLLAAPAGGIPPEQSLRFSLRASEASSPEYARALSLEAFGGTGRVSATGDASGVTGEALAPAVSRGLARFQSGVETCDEAEPPVPAGKPSAREILGRKPGEEPEGAGRSLRKAGMSGLGFLIGLAFGSIAGAAAAAYAVWTTPNPDLAPWKPVLFLPAIAAGAVVGQLAAPFMLAEIFEEAEWYD